MVNVFDLVLLSFVVIVFDFDRLFTIALLNGLAVNIFDLVLLPFVVIVFDLDRLFTIALLRGLRGKRFCF